MTQCVVFTFHLTVRDAHILLGNRPHLTASPLDFAATVVLTSEHYTLVKYPTCPVILLPSLLQSPSILNITNLHLDNV